MRGEGDKYDAELPEGEEAREVAGLVEGLEHGDGEGTHEEGGDDQPQVHEAEGRSGPSDSDDARKRGFARQVKRPRRGGRTGE